MGGFNDPDTNKKAQEKSLLVRRKKRDDTLAKIFNEEYDPENPATVTEKDVESFKDLQLGFIPSVPQLKILAIALSLDHGTSIRSWFAAAGLNRNDWYHWIRNPDFVTWWNKSFNKGIEQYRSEWVAIGLKRMKNVADPKAFDYWKAAGEKLFGFISELKVKTDKTPEEEALTKELLDLVKDINIERKSQVVEGIAEEIIEKPKEIEKIESTNS